MEALLDLQRAPDFRGLMSVEERNISKFMNFIRISTIVENNFLAYLPLMTWL